MLRVKLVYGVRHEKVTNRLLAEKALELALAIESTERDTKQLQSTQAMGTPQENLKDAPALFHLHI